MRAAIDVHAHVAPANRLDELRSISPDTTPIIDYDSDAQGDSVGDGGDIGEVGAGMIYFRYPNGTVNGPVPRSVVDIDHRLAAMAKTGVTHQVLSTRPQMFTYDSPGALAAELAGLSNDSLVELAAAHPEEFSVLAALPMQDTDRSVAEIARHASNPAVRGVMIDSNIDGRDLAERAFDPIWAALEAADLCVLVHPYQGDVVGKERLSRHYLFNLIGNPADTTIAMANVIFGGLIDRFPGLRWGFVHGGGVAPYLVGRWDHGWRMRAVTRELIPDRLPSELLRACWYDHIVHDQRTLRYLAEIVGWDRIMIGSDCPFDMGLVDPVEFVDAAGLDGDNKAALLSTNAETFLRSR